MSEPKTSSDYIRQEMLMLDDLSGYVHRLVTGHKLAQETDDGSRIDLPEPIEITSADGAIDIASIQTGRSRSDILIGVTDTEFPTLPESQYGLSDLMAPIPVLIHIAQRLEASNG